MTSDPEQEATRREVSTSLLSLCGTLAGVCIGIVAFINGMGRGAGTLIDDVLATCAAAFLACIYLLVWSMRTASARRAGHLARLAEVVFLSALTVMIGASFAMVYTVW